MDPDPKEGADLETSDFTVLDSPEQGSIGQYHCGYIKYVCLPSCKHGMLLNLEHDALTETATPSSKVGLMCTLASSVLKPWPVVYSMVEGFFPALEGQYWDASL